VLTTLSDDLITITRSIARFGTTIASLDSRGFGSQTFVSFSEEMGHEDAEKSRIGNDHVGIPDHSWNE
jgi:hypothetical protein